MTYQLSDVFISLCLLAVTILTHRRIDVVSRRIDLLRRDLTGDGR